MLICHIKLILYEVVCKIDNVVVPVREGHRTFHGVKYHNMEPNRFKRVNNGMFEIFHSTSNCNTLCYGHCRGQEGV
jgi:hypothetical protein